MAEIRQNHDANLPSEGAGWARLEPAAWLRVTGEDASTFLQGQFTQELRPDRAPAVVYGLWLNQKGKVLADSFALRVGEQEWWLMSYSSPAAVIRERLEAFIIADDVVIEDHTPAGGGIVVIGASGADWLAAAAGGLPEEGEWMRWGQGFVFHGRRGIEPAYECVGIGNVEAPADSALLSAEALERARIIAGVPAVPVDIGLGELPNEGGLEAAAISYTKGCYLGQEVMARLKAMGRVRRQLRQLRGSGEPPGRVPAPLYQNGKSAGELRSVALAENGGGWVGLGLIMLLACDESAPLSLALEGEGNVELVGAP